MANHPNRSRHRAAANPTPEQVRAARDAAGHTQTEAARTIGLTLVAWQRYEAGERRMHPTYWDAYLLRTDQHPTLILADRGPAQSDQSTT
ncbi:helix-turn-helix transcriptional regulator [Orrella sp. JC864]|uniref:helix-turn-helix domain-containing protein n=1 Tax=Orrella sp. JC864 TaxID=3120298 RepID=UPI0030097250